MSDTTTRGGVIVDRPAASTGTLSRPVSPARKESPARQGRVPRQGRTRPEREDARTAPVPSQERRSRTAPSRARRAQAEPRRTQADPRRRQPPVPGASQAKPKRPQAEPQPKRIRTAVPVSPAASNRMPFIVLLCGLLGGALASALVISTTLAEGSFEISKLQQSDSSLARQRQQLQDQVSQARSAPVLQQRAYELGMRPSGQLQFLNLKTGKVENASGSAGAGSAANETGPGAAVRNP